MIVPWRVSTYATKTPCWLTFSQQGGPANVPWPGRTPAISPAKSPAKQVKLLELQKQIDGKNAKRTVKMMKNVTLNSLVSHVSVHVSKIFSLKLVAGIFYTPLRFLLCLLWSLHLWSFATGIATPHRAGWVEAALCTACQG